MKESKVKPNRLKFASAETRLMHRVIFPKQEKKEAFQRFVVQAQRKIFRLPWRNFYVLIIVTQFMFHLFNFTIYVHDTKSDLYFEE